MVQVSNWGKKYQYMKIMESLVAEGPTVGTYAQKGRDTQTV